MSQRNKFSLHTEGFSVLSTLELDRFSTKDINEICFHPADYEIDVARVLSNILNTVINCTTITLDMSKQIRESDMSNVDLKKLLKILEEMNDCLKTVSDLLKEWFGTVCMPKNVLSLRKSTFLVTKLNPSSMDYFDVQMTKLKNVLKSFKSLMTCFKNIQSETLGHKVVLDNTK